jgi:hypothetical protein
MHTPGSTGPARSVRPRRSAGADALLVRRYRQFLAAIVAQAVRDGDDEWLRGGDCRELIELIGLDPQAAGRTLREARTADCRHPAPGPSLQRRGRGRGVGDGDDGAG